MQKRAARMSGAPGGRARAGLRWMASRLLTRDAGRLMLLIIPIALLWNTPVVYPLKILVVFFHEISHGLASILTGGHMVQINLNRHEGGSCLTLGGSTFLILNAGYLGSMIAGGAILVSSRTRFDRAIAAALGAAIILMGLGYVRPIFSLGFPFCILAGAALIVSGLKLPDKFNDAVLKVIGLVSCLYAVLDIVSDTLSRRLESSDAGALASYTHIPSVVWGTLWLGLAVIGSLFFLALAGNPNKDKSQKGQ